MQVTVPIWAVWPGPMPIARNLQRPRVQVAIPGALISAPRVQVPLMPVIVLVPVPGTMQMEPGSHPTLQICMVTTNAIATISSRAPPLMRTATLSMVGG